MLGLLAYFVSKWLVFALLFGSGFFSLFWDATCCAVGLSPPRATGLRRASAVLVAGEI